MKSRFLFYALFVFLFAACGKDKAAGEGNGGGDTTILPPKQEIRISQSIFLDPVRINNKESDTRIMDTLVQYLKHTPKGADVHLNIFLFSYTPLLNAVKDAYNRGVNVYLAIDNGRDESEKENKETILQLMSVFRSPSRVVTVRSDASATAIDHNKYALFSQIDLPQGMAKNVVFSSSHNFILAGTKKIQDAVVMSNKDLYGTFLNNWNEVAARSKSGMKNFTYTVADFDSLQVYFFPRRKNGVWDGKDTYLEIFDKISDYPSATVKVLMSDWSRVEVAEKLTELQQKGVRVEVIAKDKAEAVILNELDRLRAAGGYVKVLKMSEKNNHAKVTIISGIWDGKKQNVVFTGSHNFTYNALKNNNEVLLMLRTPRFFQDYNQYFDRLKDVL